MKKQASLAVLALAFAAGSAFAAANKDSAPADATTPKGKQQARFSMCSKDAKAKALKGAERREFMSTCLKNKA